MPEASLRATLNRFSYLWFEKHFFSALSFFAVCGLNLGLITHFRLNRRFQFQYTPTRMFLECWFLYCHTKRIIYFLEKDVLQSWGFFD